MWACACAARRGGAWHGMAWHGMAAMPCHAMPCHAMPCHAMPRAATPRRARAGPQSDPQPCYHDSAKTCAAGVVEAESKPNATELTKNFTVLGASPARRNVVAWCRACAISGAVRVNRLARGAQSGRTVVGSLYGYRVDLDGTLEWDRDQELLVDVGLQTRPKLDAHIQV